MSFSLDPRLLNDCEVIGDLPLCRVLLMKDSRYPWCILVPRQADITEIYQLSVEQQQQLLAESSLLGKKLMAMCEGRKLNVAALGNVVSQLHVHHVVRFENDAAWPGPVWGVGTAEPYDNKSLAAVIDKLRQDLAEQLI